MIEPAPAPEVEVPPGFSLAIVAQTLITGGAQRQLVQLARVLHACGVRVTVIAFYANGELAQDLVAAQVPYICLNKRGRYDLVGFLARLVSALRACAPTAIYGFMTVPNILLVLLRPWLPRAKVVWGVRATNLRTDRYDWLVGVTMAIESRLSRHADLVISNSVAGRDDVIARGFPAASTVVVANGVDTDRFSFDAQGRERVRREWGVAPAQLLVGVPARLDPMKGHDRFLRAAALAVQALPDVRFVFVGDGAPPFAASLHQLAEECGVRDRVTWAGTRADMPAVYSAIDIVVSASTFGEGFSNVVGEAMACGRPCVVTDVGDSKAIVGDTGVAVPPEDPRAMADAIVRMAHADLAALGVRARARAESEFGVDAMVTRTMRAILSTGKANAVSPQPASFLERVRLHELETAVASMPPNARVLELGAGTGWQARRLSELGYVVSAIDIPMSNYRGQRVWPITDYDGHSIPFENGSFDVVFSSNVLEHIAHVEAFQAEILRVLRPGGRAVHLLPTATWRLWTSLAHYAYLVKRVFSIARPREAVADGDAPDLAERVRRRGVLGLLGRVLVSARHGEIGGPITELYYFSRLRWTPLFGRNGWIVRQRGSNGLFYTGYAIAGGRLSLAARAHLGRLLGRSCHLYVLEKRNSARD